MSDVGDELADVPGLVRLGAGELSLVVAPEVGGSIARFDRVAGDARTPILRPSPRAAIAARNARLMSCYPMVPFPGMLKDARFAFRGATHQLAINFPDRPVALHGDGWQSVWSVGSASTDTALLVHEGGPPRFPYPYRAEQRFRLSPSALEIELTLTNTGPGDMPGGIGLHPYYRRTADARLQASATAVWENAADGTLTRRRPIPREWDFTDLAPIRDLRLDHYFEGWDRRATMVYGAGDLRIDIRASADFTYLLLFSPDDRAIVCVEPVTGLADGFNRMEAGQAAHGARVLAPGETLQGTMTLTIERAGAAES